ncbi:HAD-like domain-containing protein [Mycena vulgaris]|nr:HAD-like domain-containing protein [Mycena vulgaris]
MGDLRITSHKKALRPPPLFDPPALQIMYFDIYGTLIDNESGIFDALQPLLVRCPHRFERREALTFYFESEIEMKQRMPAAPYSEILTQAYTDMASRLGHPTTEDEASSFASSIFEWPLFDGAVWCLQILKPWIPVLVGLFDVDFETVLKTPSFATLAPLFAEIFTRDASHAYRPDPMAFEPPFKYHDDLGIRREQRCLVSNGLLRDLEPAREQGIPAIWMCFPESLAGRVPSLERSVPWDVCTDFPHLVFAVLSETGALPLPPSADRAISPIV